MRTSSPRNALAFLGDKLQAKRDEEYLEEYRKQAHAALLKDPLSTTFSDEPDIVHKNPRIKPVIKYNAQNPGDGSSFSSSSQVLYYSPVNPSAEHGRSSNSPRRRPSEFSQAQDGSVTSPRPSMAATSPRRSTLGRSATAAERTLSMAATLHLAVMTTHRSDQEREGAADAEAPASPIAAAVPDAGAVVEHTAAVHWGSDTEGQQNMQRTGFAAKKAVCPRPPRPGMPPTLPLSRITQKHVSDSNSSTSVSSDPSSPSSSGSQGSRSDDSGVESSSDSEHESDLEQLMLCMSASEPASTDSHQLPDGCLRDRCLQPLHKLQQQSFMPGGRQGGSPMAEPPGLVWQDSGFMTPFSPRLLGLKRGESRQISTAATGVTSVSGRGISGAAAVPMLLFPSEAGSPLNSQRSALSSSGHSSSAHALATSAAVAASEAAAPSASGQHASRGSLVMQQLSESVLSELASQQPEQQPAGLRHPLLSSAALGRGLGLQKGSGDKHRERAEASAECRAGGKRRKSKSCHATDPAMEHVEDHLQILKHVHVKQASPRSMMINKKRAEALGLAALPATLSSPTTLATVGSGTLQLSSATAPALGPVSGQGSWCKTGLHMLPEELNAAVLEALAAEAAGIGHSASRALQRPATSPAASYKMRMEANMKALVYDDALDVPNAGPKRIPAINPNRAYLKSLAQGSAKKHFQSVEVDLREAHRRLIATSKDLQPVTYAAAARTHVYAC